MALIDNSLTSIWQQQARYDEDFRKANGMLDAAVAVSQTWEAAVLLDAGLIRPQMGGCVSF